LRGEREGGGGAHHRVLTLRENEVGGIRGDPPEVHWLLRFALLLLGNCSR
jgi:hypothetical protein